MARQDRRPLDFYLGLRYPVTLYEEPEGGYTAEIKDLPGCITQGETSSEALEMIEDARRTWIEGAYEHGDEVPLPSDHEERFSGRVLVRMPRILHRRLAEGAEREGVSLNQYVVALLAASRLTTETAMQQVTSTPWHGEWKGLAFYAKDFPLGTITYAVSTNWDVIGAKRIYTQPSSTALRGTELRPARTAARR